MVDCVVQQVPPIVASAPAPGTSASPGFQYGRAGDVTAGTYLQVIANVPSSTAGLIVPFTGIITRVFVTNENDNTFTVKVQKRTDPGPVYTDLGTPFSLTAARKGEFNPSISVTDGDELVVLMSSGTCRNVQVGLIIEQDT
jgi:hypothetical protein